VTPYGSYKSKSSEEVIASIIRVKWIGELETILVTSSWSMVVLTC
jgi:hypothetical protein